PSSGAMERGARGVSDLSGSCQTAGNRHSFSASEAESPREAGRRAFQPGARMAGCHGPESDGPPAPAPPANDHAKRQRNQPPRLDPAPPAQTEKEQPGPRQD